MITCIRQAFKLTALLMCSWNVNAALIHIGDTQQFVLRANFDGDPNVNINWALPVPLTAGSYHMYVDDPRWNYGIFGYGNNVVGGFSLYNPSLQALVSVPFVHGTDPNATIRSFDFSVGYDQVALAGVADNYLLDNSGTPTFTLTKTADAAAIPEPGVILLMLGGVLGFLLQSSIGKNRSKIAFKSLLAFLGAAFMGNADASLLSINDSSFELGGSAHYSSPGHNGLTPVTLYAWNFTGSSGITTWDTSHTGVASAYVNAFISGASGSISQSIPTVAGSSYLVDFWLAGNCCAAGNILVSFGDTLGFSYAYNMYSAFAFTKYSFTATATSALTVFSLTGTNLNGTFFLDDVDISDHPSNSTVPEPESVFLVGIGLACIAAAHNTSREKPME